MTTPTTRAWKMFPEYYGVVNAWRVAHPYLSCESCGGRILDGAYLSDSPSGDGVLCSDCGSGDNFVGK